MFSRAYVEDAEHGVPFMGSSDMLQSDLSRLPLLSKKAAFSPRLRFLKLEEGMTLISCSGTIGRTVYVRPDMTRIWSSQHIMKVVPNPGVIPPGYLYAVLSSKFGKAQVTGGTYGAIIQHIEAQHLAHIKIPRLQEKVELRAHELITSSAALRATAWDTVRASERMLSEQVGLAPLHSQSVSNYGVTHVNSSALNSRLDAAYHSLSALEVQRQLDHLGVPVERLATVTERLFKPPIFKRIWVESSQYGPLFISGLDAYRLKPEEPRYVSRKTQHYDEFILKPGWVIFQAAGQIYGLFGRPILVSGWIEWAFCADDMYRVVPRSEDDGAYLWAFFRTAHGQILLKRQACGDSIPRVWDPQMHQICVPWPDRKVRRAIARPILKAHGLMDEAYEKECSAISLVERTIEEAV
jgi:type I restriction enzyme S subunit